MPLCGLYWQDVDFMRSHHMKCTSYISPLFSSGRAACESVMLQVMWAMLLQLKLTEHYVTHALRTAIYKFDIRLCCIRNMWMPTIPTHPHLKMIVQHDSPIQSSCTHQRYELSRGSDDEFNILSTCRQLLDAAGSWQCITQHSEEVVWDGHQIWGYYPSSQRLPM